MDDKEIAKKVKDIVDAGLVASMAEARRYVAMGFTADKLKERRTKNKGGPLMARRDYGEKEEKMSTDMGQTAYIDHIGGGFEVRLPNGTIVKESDSDDAYGAVQKYAMRTHSKVKIVDVEQGVTKEVDRHGNIEDSVKSASDSNSYKYKDLQSTRNATEDQPQEQGSLLETMKSDRGINETVRVLLNERLVSSIGEARRLAQEGYTVEEVRKARGGKNWAKGKWASDEVVKRLDALAEKIESYGLRTAAEKLDIISNTIEASWTPSPKHQKAIDNVAKAMNLLGWQGGTVHQVVDETGLTIEQIHNAEDIESLVREALKKKGKMLKKASYTDDPTIDEMRAFLKKKFGGLVDQESLESEGVAAMHWFASDYHGGQRSELYKVFSLGFKPGPSHHSVKDEGEVASEMYDALKEEYVDSYKKPTRA